VLEVQGDRISWANSIIRTEIEAASQGAGALGTRLHERMKGRGAAFTTPPTDVTGSKIAMLNDTCGNLIQITQLMRR
jgi:hypothetical protein